MALKHNILHRDGTSKIYQSPATIGQYLYFTTRGDDIANNIIGKGTQLVITNTDSKSEIIAEAQFLEDIQLKDAYIFWEHASWGDIINAEVILPANTPYLHPTHKGNAAMVNGVVNYITSSPSPDETWVGDYLLAPVDISIVRFVNEFRIMGDNQTGTLLESSGVALITKDLKMRITYTNEIAPNPNVQIVILIELYRENTI